MLLSFLSDFGAQKKVEAGPPSCFYRDGNGGPGREGRCSKVTVSPPAQSRSCGGDCFYRLSNGAPHGKRSLLGGQTWFRECSQQNGLRRAFLGESRAASLLPERDFFSCMERDFPFGSGLTIYSDQRVENKVQTSRVWGSSHKGSRSRWALKGVAAALGHGRGCPLEKLHRLTADLLLDLSSPLSFAS